MLVPTMSLIEIRNEIEKDFPIVVRKSYYLEKELFKIHRPKGEECIVKMIEYLSKNKNKWIIRLEIKKKTMAMTYMVYYYNDIGLMGIVPIAGEKLLIFHTSHMFKRFNERLHLGLKTPHEIMLAFLDECAEYSGDTIEVIEEGIRKMFFATRKGYFLGIKDDKLDMIRLNTFISHEMLKKGQLEFANQLKNDLDDIEIREGSIWQYFTKK